MSGIKYLLDTCFIIQWHAQDNKTFEIISRLNLQPFECAYSDISHAEVFGYHSISPKAEYELTALLFDIERLSVSKSIIDIVIAIRKIHKIKLPDALILATAKQHNLTLLTLDDKLQRLAQLAGVKIA